MPFPEMISRFRNLIAWPKTHYALYGLASCVVIFQFWIIGYKDPANGNLKKKWDNYFTFRQSWEHLKKDQNLYALYPEEQFHGFKYSPAFAVCAGVLSVLPPIVGLGIFLLLPALLFVYAVQHLPGLSQLQKGGILVYLLMQTVISMEQFQTNVILTALLILFLIALENKKAATAGISLGFCVFIKPYLLPMGLLFGLYPEKFRNLAAFSITCLILIFLPLPITGWNELMNIYQDWYGQVSKDLVTYQGMSVFGLVSKLFSVNIEKAWIYLPLAILVLATCIYTLRNNQAHSRISFFSFLLISLVIFNPKAESNTYFMAISVAAIWAFSSGLGPKTIFLLAFSLLFTSFALTDLVPHSFREAVVYPYCFPTIASSCVWVALLLEFWLGKKMETSELG